MVSGPPRPGGPVDLVSLIPGGAVVVLHANLALVRQDPVRYDRIASQLASELGLAADAATLRQLLDVTDDAVGAFAPSAGGATQEGMLVFSGRYTDDHFRSVLAIAAGRHGSSPPSTPGASGQTYVMGNATLAQLDQWTWALAVGPGMRAHLTQVALSGGRAFSQNLLEFGPRIGLPPGSTQAWASQDTQAGTDMVGLVFQGETPTMVHNFVTTVMRHLGI